MTVLIRLTIVGVDSGPLYDLYSSPDGITFTTLVTGITKTALVAGYTSTTVPNGTTIIRVLSTGSCTNYVDLTVTGNVTTTTTTTTGTPTTTSTSTTAAPSISISSATCKSGNCNDNSTCAVHLPINIYNAPVGYYVQMVVEGSSGASITYLQSNGYAIYTENNALATLQVRFDLYNTSGGTLLSSTGTTYLSHQSYWSMLTNCI